MLAITLCASTQISNHGSLQACCRVPVPNLTYDVIMSSELCLLESFQHFLLPGQLVKIPPVCLLNIFNIFCIRAIAFEDAAGVSHESFQHFLLPGYLLKIAPMRLLESFQHFLSLFNIS